jgi:hypothetical protein
MHLRVPEVRMAATTEAKVFKACLGDSFWSPYCLNINYSSLSAR